MLILSLLLRQCIRLISLFTVRVGQVSTCGHRSQMRREAGKFMRPGRGKKEKLLYFTKLQSSGYRELSLNAVQELKKED